MKFINWKRKGNFKKGFLNIKTIQYLVSGTKHNICSLYRCMIKESNIECFCCKFVKRDLKAHLELQGTLGQCSAQSGPSCQWRSYFFDGA